MFFTNQSKNSPYNLKQSFDGKQSLKFSTLSSQSFFPSLKSDRKKFEIPLSKDMQLEDSSYGFKILNTESSQNLNSSNTKTNHIKLRRSVDGIISPIKQDHPFNYKHCYTNENDKDDSNKKMQLWDILTDLKFAAGKYDKNTELIIPYKQDLIKIFQSLSLLAKVNSPFYEHMKFVLKLLNMAIYFNSKIFKSYEEILGDSDNPDIRMYLNTYGDGDCKIPYFTVVQTLIQEVVKLKEAFHNTCFDYQNQIGNMEDKMKAQNEIINQLKENIKNMDSQEIKEAYIIEMQELKTENNKLIQENNKLKENINESKSQNGVLSEKIAKFNKSIEEKNSMIDILINEKLKIKQNNDQIKVKYRQIKDNTSNMKDMIDKLIVRLSNIKNEVNNLKQQNEQLAYENDKLRMRAAVGFENLTPRPDYHQLLKEKNIDLTFLTSNNEKKKEINMSTTQFFNTLLTKYIELSRQKCTCLESDRSKCLTPPPDRNRRNSAMNNLNLSNKKRHSAVLLRSPLFDQKKIIRSSFAAPKSSSLLPKDEIDVPMTTSDYLNNDQIEQMKNTEPDKNDIIKLEIPISFERTNFGFRVLEKSDNLMVDIIETKKSFEKMQIQEDIEQTPKLII